MVRLMLPRTKAENADLDRSVLREYFKRGLKHPTINNCMCYRPHTF
jgi:hypothetical protein